MNDNGMLCRNWRLPEVTIDPFWKAIIVVNTRRLVSKHRYHFFPCISTLLARILFGAAFFYAI
jgi:hypothetical protein